MMVCKFCDDMSAGLYYPQIIWLAGEKAETMNQKEKTARV